MIEKTEHYECADLHILSADFLYECVDFLLSNAHFKKRGFNKF